MSRKPLKSSSSLSTFSISGASISGVSVASTNSSRNSISLFSSIEDLSASQDSLDRLCVDNLASEEQVQDVLSRLLADVDKLKKKVKYFKHNYDHMENKNEALEKQNNYLKGQIMKFQCDNDRLLKENERLKDKMWKLQDSRQVMRQDERQQQPCAIISEISEEYVYV